MNNINAHSHLTLEERRIIMTGICNGSTKTAIAKTIGKDKSTIGKDAAEIREYRKHVKDKYTDRRMYAVQLRGEGLKNKDICEKLDCDVSRILYQPPNA